MRRGPYCGFSRVTAANTVGVRVVYHSSTTRAPIRSSARTVSSGPDIPGTRYAVPSCPSMSRPPRG
eukprot:7069857-Lingulodinium_polyedra.AAC.1